MIKRNILDCMQLVGATPAYYEGEKTYVSTGAVDCDHIDYEQTEFVTYDGRPSRANLSVSEGDILFAKMCGTKKTLRIDANMADHLYSTGFCAVHANESVMIADLLYHLLASEQFLMQKDQNSSGATQKAITNAGLKKITVPVPNLKEQREIAAKLDCIERMMAKRREQIDYLDQLVKSRFIELFGDGCDGRFPMKTLPQIISSDKHALKRGPFGGALKKEDFVETGYLVYEQRHAIHNDFEYEKYYITAEKYKDMIMFKVVPGDLIVSCSGVTLGRIAEIPSYAKEGIINQALLKISLDQSIMTNTFFIHQFRSGRVQDILFGFCRGSGIPNFPSMGEVKAVEFICPPIALQEQFVAFVEQTDKSKLAVQQGLQELEILKKSLMQQYFG